MRSVSLYYRDDRSDKQYTVSIDQLSPDQYAVNFAFGPRGGTMQSGTKTKSPVSLAEAEAVFEHVISEKTAKGYTPGPTAPPIQRPALTSAAPSSAPTALPGFIRPMLLNPIDAAEAQHLLRSPEWWLQMKFDGIRIQLHRRHADIKGFSRTGREVALPMAVVEAARHLPGDHWIMDGELIGETAHVFDILSADGRDLTGETYAFRLGYLSVYFETIPSARPIATSQAIQMSPTAYTIDEKMAAYNCLREQGAEGVVFKLKTARHQSGRPNSGGAGRKVKFVATASVIVARHNDKRSVAMKLCDGTEVGDVTIPPNKEIPAVGAIVEVRYLYAHRGGSLSQAVFLGVREDVTTEDCNAAQLQFKNEARETVESR